MRTAELICEGVCNHYETARIDKELLKEYAKRGGGLGVTGDESLWRRIRKLAYTTHDVVSNRFARCQVCKWVRVWGWSETVGAGEARRGLIETRAAMDAEVVPASAYQAMIDKINAEPGEEISTRDLQQTYNVMQSRHLEQVVVLEENDKRDSEPVGLADAAVGAAAAPADDAPQLRWHDVKGKK